MYCSDQRAKRPLESINKVIDDAFTLSRANQHYICNSDAVCPDGVK